MSIQAYCQQKGIKHSTFHYWKKKFHQQDFTSPAEDKGFSRISITEAPDSGKATQATIVLTYPSGARLEFFSPLDASFLKSLLC